METRYELLVKIGDSNYYLDTFGDEAISLNYDIANIRDISGRNSSYSKTIKLPDSQHNREVLGFITNISVESTVDANKIIKAWILVDTVQVFEGNLQLKKFQKNFKTGEMEIEVVVYADNDSFFTTMGDRYISDLDFSQFNHVWSASNIRFSWTQSSGFAYRYPLIDYGSNWSISDLNGSGFIPAGLTQGTATQSLTVDELYPAISRKVIFDRIFQENGFSYDSDFLNSDYFKDQYIPFNGTKLENIGLNENLFQAYSAGGQTLNTGLNEWTSILFPNEVVDEDFVWSPTFSRFENYTSTTLSVKFKVRLSLDILGSPNNPLLSYTLDVRRNTLSYETHMIWNFGNNSSPNAYIDTNGDINFYVETSYISIPPGGVVFFRIQRWGNDLALGGGGNLTVLSASNVSNSINPFLVVGGEVGISQNLPKKFKQRDFILSTCREFNLYIEPSKEYPNTLIIEPRDDFYSEGVIKDWTKKLDLLKPISVDILAETQNRITTFSHKEDKDYLNAFYKQQFSQIFGQYDFDSGNEFAKNNNKKVESMFSPTPLNLVPGSQGLIIPLITKDTQFSYNLDSKGKLETNPRVLHWGGLVPFNNGFDVINFDGIFITYSGAYCYPYAGNIDNPYDPTVDNNFGAAENVFYPNDGLTQNGLFNRFWRKTMLELTNKDSRVVTCYLYLTSEDIYNFSFSDKIFIEFNGDSSYYKVNKIMDYNPGISQPCKVELLKTQEIQVNTFTVKPLGKPAITIRPERRIAATTITADTVSLGAANAIFSDEGVVVVGNFNYIGDSSEPVGILGDDNTIGTASSNILLVGDENEVQDFVIKSITSGDNNIIGTYSEDVYAFGDNNIIGTASQNIYLLGNNNTVSDGVTSSYAFGDNITLTQSNTLYIGGEVIFSGTVSGIPGSDGTGFYEDFGSGFEDVNEFTIEDGPYMRVYQSQYSNIRKSVIIDSGIDSGNVLNVSEPWSSSSMILMGSNNEIQTDNPGLSEVNVFIANSEDTFSYLYATGSVTIMNSLDVNLNAGGRIGVYDSNNISFGASDYSFIQSCNGVTMSGLTHTGVMLLPNFVATQSNTLYTPNLYVTGNLRVTGDILGYTASVGLQEVLEEDNVVFDIDAGSYTVLSMTGSNIILGDISNEYVLGFGSNGAIVGGYQIKSTGQGGFMGGGNSNILYWNAECVIVGGITHTIGTSSTYCFIGGGQNNQIPDNIFASSILGGDNHNNKSSSSIILGGGSSTIHPSSDYSSILGGNNQIIGTSSLECSILGGSNNTISNGADRVTIIGATGINGTQSNTIYSTRQMYKRTGDVPTLIASVGWGGGLTASSMAGYVEITPDSSALANGTLFILLWALSGKHYTTFTPANVDSAGLTFWTEYDDVNKWTSLKYSGTLVASTTYKWHYTNNPLI